MSAQHAAERIVHLTQVASYHQGRASARQEAMRLVRTLKHQVEAESLGHNGTLAALSRLEEVLYDLTKESEAESSRHNTILRNADALLSNDQQ